MYSQCVLYFIAFEALCTDTIESLVIAYKSAENPDDMLSSLKKIWSVVEEYVKADKLSSVGLSDINTNTFIELFQWADVRISLHKITSMYSHAGLITTFTRYR